MIDTETADQQREADSPPESVQKEIITTGQAAQVLIEEGIDSSPSELDILNEVGSNYSFKGIMRKLDMHQQSLSRALHRLEEMGLVKKSDGGYSLNQGGESVASIATITSRQMGRQYIQLLQTYIPVSSVRPEEVARNLVGRWFKNLRWLGMIAGTSGYTLQWSSEEGTYQVNMQIISDYIVIETNAASEKDKVDAMAGSYAIFEHVARLLQSKVRAYSVDGNDFGGISRAHNN